MKHRAWIIFTVWLGVVATAVAQTPVYVSIVMHNEEPPGYPDFTNNPAVFQQQRSNLVTFVDMLAGKGVMFNYQSDWNFLQAVDLFDAGTPSTDGKNIVRYISDLGFEVDPHAHETEYNYADVAYLINQLGVTPSRTVGGFAALPSSISKLAYLQAPITGWHYPYIWECEILWGAATLNHTNEALLHVSGIWKPEATNTFVRHDESAPLPNVGGYNNNWDGLAELIQMQQNGQLHTDRMYTCTIFLSQGELTFPAFRAEFEQYIDQFQSTGHVEWVGLQQAVGIWQTNFQAQPNLLPAPRNLLENPGAEIGAVMPVAWDTFSPTPLDFSFARDDTNAHGGTASLRIDGSGSGIGLWRQSVPVEPDTVYRLSGYTAFHGVPPTNECGLRVLFRDAASNLVTMIDLPSHCGFRDFALDYPPLLKVRSPTNAATAEINGYLSGQGTVWFDDLVFGPAPAGEIGGRVTDDGQPVADARVYIRGDPWGRTCEAYTDTNGYYTLEDIPAAFPRYMLFAEKNGYRSRPRGGVEMRYGQYNAVHFELAPGADPDHLHMKFGTLAHVRNIPAYNLPPGAVIPTDTNDYPADIHPYLAADEYIMADHPAVTALAARILQSVPVPARSNTFDVVTAVYEWIVRNIEHDGVFNDGGLDTPFKDVTCGIWQTISGRGWCWGSGFYDWAYTPPELLQAQCGICVEHSWLFAALLRALGVPARACSGSNEYWAQTDILNGVWVHMGTTGGRTSYRENGQTGNAHQGSFSEQRFSVSSRPMLHEDWNAAQPGPWREAHPWSLKYTNTHAGFTQAVAVLDTLASSGTVPMNTPVVRDTNYYEMHLSDITINLLNMDTQRVLDVRFPQVTDSAFSTNTGRQAYWVNHPECVISTYQEHITTPVSAYTECWFHVVCDLTRMGTDTDGDQVGDLWEGFLNTDTNAMDSDMDGLTDYEEIWGIDDAATAIDPEGRTSDPGRADTDGDGAGDGAEAVAGTRPDDADSLLVITHINRDPTSQSMTITWSAVTNRLYTLLRSTNQMQTFETLHSNLMLHGGDHLACTNTTHPDTSEGHYGIRVSH